MSTEEDLELRDLVTQALENNGVLSKIRAQLRASVFLALEEQELLQNESTFTNKSFKEFVKTTEGALLTQLVREFLEYFELDFTLSVFDPETYHGKDYEYSGRNALVKDLGIKNLNGDKGPLLAQVYQLAFKEKQEEIFSSPKEDGDHGNLTDNLDNKTVLRRNMKNTNSASGTVIESEDIKICSVNAAGEGSDNPPKNDETSFSNAAGIAAGKSSSEGLKLHSAGESSEVKKSNVHTNPLQEKSTTNLGGLTSLSNLPPLLDPNKQNMEFFGSTSHSKKDINQIKSMINALDVSDNNYEEDFQSSASGSGVEGRSGKNSVDVSEEIEEDIGSGIDDLLSNASGLEDMTVDATVSNISGVGDYMENI